VMAGGGGDGGGAAPATSTSTSSWDRGVLPAVGANGWPLVLEADSPGWQQKCVCVVLEADSPGWQQKCVCVGTNTYNHTTLCQYIKVHTLPGVQ
jgi:hypothetical protein